MLSKEEIKAIREKLSMTQAELANELGCPQPTVARWESGVVKISNSYEQLLKKLVSVQAKK